MTPMQQILLGVGAKKKTYMDDVFSTYVYKGNATSGRAINTGVDMTKGGMTWLKSRSSTTGNMLIDTVRGSDKQLYSHNNTAESSNSGFLSAFTSTGFTLGSDGDVNSSSHTFTSWSFRKAPGFFDIVTWTGNGTAGNTVSHDLGSVPGVVFVRRISSSGSPASGDWAVYHRSIGGTKSLRLNEAGAANTTSGAWNDTDATASVLTLGTSGDVNGNGDGYIGYFFGGGKGTTDKAVEFDGTNDYLTIPDNDAWNLGNTFTIEAWVNLDALNDYNVIIAQGSSDWYMSVNSNGSCQFYDFTGSEQIDSAASAVSTNTWTHIAIVVNGGTAQWYVNGKQSGSSGSLNVQGGSNGVSIGAQGSGYKVNGEISNLRVTKGQALYTTNFNVPHDPLTQTSQNAVSSNVKLLCCNGSTTTASTVTPDTISATGSPSVTTNSSIFDDTAANVFGENEDQGIIKTGSYIGNGNADGPEINLGWEPQWLLVKCTDGSGSFLHWLLVDNMRGTVTGGDESRLFPNLSNTEDTADMIDFTSTGFKLTSADDKVNTNGDNYIFLAIRRPDGYVGKPAEAGTSVFAMDTGAGNSTIPNFDSTFPVDMAIWKKPDDGTHAWGITTRFTWNNYLPITNAAQTSGSTLEFDSNVGWQDGSWADSNYQSWMWKRHTGFDVVAYTGDEVAGRQIPHSLNAVPEMMWVKKRSGSKDWICYHKGLNGGTNPEQYHLHLNTNVAEAQSVNAWNNQAPTSTHFVVADDSHVNESDEPYLTMLFASVDGISKVGYYTGNNTTQTITTGFQPRFLIIKKVSGADNWLVFDTLRGWTSGATDKHLRLNANNAQADLQQGYPTATGFYLDTSDGGMNQNDERYIYYAHA